MSYPPEHHLLRDLPFEIEDTGADSSRGHLRVTPQLLTGPSGPFDIGPVLVATDVLSGFLVGRVIAPDWMATAQLAVHLAEPHLAEPVGGVAAETVAGEPDESVEVVIDATVRRAGRTTVVVGCEIRVDDSEVGDAILTFVRLPRRDGNIEIADTPILLGRRSSMALPGSGFSRPFRDHIGVELTDPSTGSARLEVVDYVRNSFGAVNGGVVTSLAAGAAAALAGDRFGVPARALDLTATYLSQGKVGPLITRGRVMRCDDVTALVRVEVLDAGVTSEGDDGRTLVVCHVACCRI